MKTTRLFTVFFTFGKTFEGAGYVTLRAQNKAAATKQWLAENPDDRVTKVIHGRIKFKPGLKPQRTPNMTDTP